MASLPSPLYRRMVSLLCNRKKELSISISIEADNKKKNFKFSSTACCVKSLSDRIKIGAVDNIKKAGVRTLLDFLAYLANI